MAPCEGTFVTVAAALCPYRQTGDDGRIEGSCQHDVEVPMSRAVGQFSVRRVVLPRAVAGLLIAIAIGVLLVAGIGSLLVNSTAATGVSLLVRESTLTPSR